MPMYSFHYIFTQVIYDSLIQTSLCVDHALCNAGNSSNLTWDRCWFDELTAFFDHFCTFLFQPSNSPSKLNGLVSGWRESSGLVIKKQNKVSHRGNNCGNTRSLSFFRSLFHRTFSSCVIWICSFQAVRTLPTKCVIFWSFICRKRTFVQ